MTPRSQRRHEIDEKQELLDHLQNQLPLTDWVLQGLDLTDVDLNVDVTDTILLGCTLPDLKAKIALIERGAHIFPPFKDLPYNPYRHSLYSPEDLLDGWDQGYVHTRDFKIYTHFDRSRYADGGVGIREALAQRLHDHGIDDGLEEIVNKHAGPTCPGTIGVMGGHSTRRDAPDFRQVAEISWKLARKNYFIASGGGPGIMEAANLGAYMAPYKDETALDKALSMLSAAPKFDGGLAEGTPEYLAAISDYVRVAREVTASFFGPNSAANARAFDRDGNEPGHSLAIPTWFYGHEPTNLFGTYVAKYFSNSLREDNLLAISTAGVIFAPGSAGTLQEVFMDLAQNHYATFVVRSPMIFLGREAYEELHQFILNFVEKRGMMDVYGDLIHLTDDVDDAVQFIEAHPSRARSATTPLYDLAHT